MRYASILLLLSLGTFFSTVDCQAEETLRLRLTSQQSEMSARLQDWTHEGVVLDTDPKHTIPISELISVRFGRETTPLSGGEGLIFLTNDDRIRVRSISIADDMLTAITSFSGAMATELKFPLEIVSAIVFELPSVRLDRSRLLADLKTLPSKSDFVFLTSGDRIQGEFENLDGAFVELAGADGPAKLDRSRVRAIRFNPELTTAVKLEGSRVLVSLVDSTRITATRIEKNGDSFFASLPNKQSIAIPISIISSCHFLNENIRTLSDQEPIAVSFQPFLSGQWSYMKNANVMRGPLRLRGIESPIGLGMHSQMTATYAIAPNDHEFRATVGIDDCANGLGSVRFSIELDGKSVWESNEITGISDPIDLPPIRLTGAKQLKLCVSFGEKTDVADYANWSEAIIISSSPK